MVAFFLRSTSLLTFSLPLLLAYCHVAISVARADIQVEFEAVQPQIELDDPLQMRIRVDVSGSSSEPRIGQPSYHAPDFAYINRYDSQNFTRTFTNGRLEAKSSYTITLMFRPKKTGMLTISKLEIPVDGKTYRGRDLNIRVSGGGAGTPPPKGYGGLGGLSGAGKRKPNREFFVRAEINTDKVYKGQQVIVSYYLYSRVTMINAEVAKFPVLEGFVKEDLDLPVLRRRSVADRVRLDGQVYERRLLARYAAYPIREGELKIDSLEIKGSYYPERTGSRGNDPFSHFFRQLTPKVASRKSEMLKVQVLSIPEEGRPESYDGAVGEYSISAAISEYIVQTGDPLSLTVMIEGQGNVSSIEEPQPSRGWPQEFELYESHSKVKVGKGGVGQKVFEFLLIAKEPGELQLPELKFSYFDPSLEEFVEIQTEPILVTANGESKLKTRADSTGAFDASSSGNTENSPREVVAVDQLQIRYIRPFSEATQVFQVFGWRPNGLGQWLITFVYMMAAGLLASSVLASGVRFFSGFSKRQRDKASSQSILDELKGIASQPSIHDAYEKGARLVLQFIQKEYNVDALALSRRKIGEELIHQHGLDSQVWKQIEQLLEKADQMLYQGSGASQADLNQAKKDLQQWAQKSTHACLSLIRR